MHGQKNIKFHFIQCLKQRAMMGNAYILPKVLTKNRRTFIVGNKITCTLYFTHRTAAKLSTLETCFVPDI